MHFQGFEQAVKVVGLFEPSTHPEQFGFEDFFEHFGEFAVRAKETGFPLPGKLDQFQVRPGDPQPVSRVFRISLPWQSALLRSKPIGKK